MTRPFELIGIDAWKKHAKAGDEDLPPGIDGLMKEISDAEPVLLKKDGTPANDIADAAGSRDIQVVYSSGSVDRDGDTIKQTGIKLTNFRRNPVVGLSHFRGQDASQHFPIARSVGLSRNEDNTKSFSVDRFVDRDMGEIGPLAETTFRMLASKFMRAASIGFRPIKFTRPDEKKEEDRLKEFWWPLDFSSVEKLEHSFVPVGSNADALVGAKSAGIDIGPIKTWAEKILDQTGHLVVSREQVEAAYKVANNNATTFMGFLTGEEDKPFQKFLDTMRVSGNPEDDVDTKELAIEIVKALKESGVVETPAPPPTEVEALKGSIDQLNTNFEKILKGSDKPGGDPPKGDSTNGETKLTDEDLAGITTATTKAFETALADAAGKLPA